ncbi:class-II fumarase/aspartase family protein [Paraburkholderia silvatlantica]|uniref:3-carboxy-cis,cis-muconate cycloisomerase n=1 Tax=Paraburkholderia silvatlantica TaxID=321895 RepID=A0ABR6FWX3_9BURK|nr:adenylosuccinate lyase family protein [Paraburkholderia silvatlantica]MBB2931938.1 3-carboxy-cis,cis-muconate cycloisomerase [Paraburkholderia silvatlantica]PVY24616.1 3-carboxy-cis,cis-muconate cycloisomerase [Paraburkholderia silvatlantica]PXW31112.1 3-carboxy-cis,cis-muconate cycloisomerase [Paraburkholderia silvatlantica]
MSALSLVDSPLFGRSFVDDEMRELFASDSFVRRCIETEVALARAQARIGVIPEKAALEIASAAEKPFLNADRLQRETEVVGYPILPIVEQLADAAGEGGRYLHWGATTQDIMDTATVLQVRTALELIDRRLGETIEALRRLAETYRDTPMAGRTHLQHALPVTFGYKAAVWLSAFRRHRERLLQLRPRVLVVEFSGAAGTLASLGSKGLDVQAELARVLGLDVPPITWHSMRDGMAEAVQLLALISGSLAKIAFDISIMASTEFGEVSEPFVRHRGASSTMPQKRNPVSCELILAAATMVRQHAGLMLDAMVHDFERATGPWHLEWAAVPESFALTSGALAQATFMLGGLEVHAGRMRSNLSASRGLIVAEAVMMALAPITGRQTAHDLVYVGCRRAIEADQSLFEVLSRMKEVAVPLGLERLRTLTDPTHYLGAAPEMVDRVLAHG